MPGALAQQRGSRFSDLVEFPTNGDVDHVAGLLSLRERQAFMPFAMPATIKLIEANSIFRVLDPSYVGMRPLHDAVELDAGFGLKVTPFFVPGKVPLHEESGAVSIGGVGETTLGLEIRSAGARLVYIPGCAKISEDILRRAAGADLLLFDGTTFTDDEMVRAGFRKRPPGAWAIRRCQRRQGSLAGFRRARRSGRKIYHPYQQHQPHPDRGIDRASSVEAAGWEVAYDGMEIAL